MTVKPIYHQLLTGSWPAISSLTVSGLLVLTNLAFPGLAQDNRALPIIPNQLNSNLSSTETDYILGAGDQIRVNIFNVPEYSGDFIILVNGVLSLPIIGEIRAEGLTLSELTQFLTQKYAVYVKRPIISVSLTAPRPLKIAVVGEVNRPGTYTVEIANGQKFPTITDVIKGAGGLTPIADVRSVTLRRFFQGQEQILTVDLWELLQQGNLAQDVTIRDGDSIYIPTASSLDLAQTRQLTDANFGIQSPEVLNVAVVGEVNRPGSYPIPPDSTGKPPRITQAIQLAGGIKPLANIRQLEIRRFDRTGAETSLTVDLWNLLSSGNLDDDLILQDGDTILIPTATDIDPQEAASLASANFSPETIQVSIIGEARGTGTLKLPPNTPLNQALLAAGGFNPTRANKKEVELIRLNPNGSVSKRKIEINLESGINEENNPILLNNDVVIVDRSGITKFTDTVGTFLNPFGQLISTFNFLNIFGLWD